MKVIKKVSIMMISLFIFMHFVPVVTVALEASELKVIDNGGVEVSDGELMIDGVEMTPGEFDQLLENAEVIEVKYDPSNKMRSGTAALAAWKGSSLAIGGLGTVTIGTGGTIILVGVGIIATAWVINKVIAYFSNKKKQAAAEVSTSIKSSYYKVNLTLCKDKYGKTARIKKSGDFNCGRGWTLSKDPSQKPHGSSHWKVKKNGVRKATIDKFGNIIRG